MATANSDQQRPDPLVSMVRALEIYNDAHSDDAWKVAMVMGIAAISLEMRDIRNLVATVVATVAATLEADDDDA